MPPTRPATGPATGRTRTGSRSATCLRRSPTPTANRCSRRSTRWANGCWTTGPRSSRSGCRCRTGTTSSSTSPRSAWTTLARCSSPRTARTASSRAPCSATTRRPPAWPGGSRGVHPGGDAGRGAGREGGKPRRGAHRRRHGVLLDLTPVDELARWSTVDGRVRLGAGVSYARIIAELSDRLPGLAMASRTVGSPQIRNRGTVGGNLGSASPAGDAHPPLLATAAEVEVASVRGSRRLRIDEFLTGPKRSALAPDELICAVHVPVAHGPQQFAKVGSRNAMVIAVCSFALYLDPERRRAGTGIGSAGPTPLDAGEAERFLEGELDAGGLWASRAALGDGVPTRFGELVAAAARPIDDVRGTAAYRVHALTVLARRAMAWAWQEYQGGEGDAV